MSPWCCSTLCDALSQRGYHPVLLPANDLNAYFCFRLSAALCDLNCLFLVLIICEYAIVLDYLGQRQQLRRRSKSYHLNLIESNYLRFVTSPNVDHHASTKHGIQFNSIGLEMSQMNYELIEAKRLTRSANYMWMRDAEVERGEEWKVSKQK